MGQLDIRKDTAEGIVEVDTGEGWRGLSPDAAREMADSYEAAVSDGSMTDSTGVQKFIRLLREYADDVESTTPQGDE